MTPSRFETGRAMLLAGLRRWYSFDKAHVEIPTVWKAFVARLPLPGQVGWTTYGVTCRADMPDQRFEYICAVEVPAFEGLPDDLGRLRMPNARYAVFEHEGPVSDIRRTIVASHDWLTANGEWVDAETPTFERYGPAFDPETGMGEAELWLPVRPA